MATHRIVAISVAAPPLPGFDSSHPVQITALQDADEGWILDIDEIVDMILLDGDELLAPDPDQPGSFVRLVADSHLGQDGIRLSFARTRLDQAGRDCLLSLPKIED